MQPNQHASDESISLHEDRALGPELTEEGWHAWGECLLWFHTPTHEVVSIDVGWLRRQCKMPAFPCEPSSPNVKGTILSRYRCDELGNPLVTDARSMWIESWTLAIKTGRELRQQILDSRKRFERSKQLTFDDLLIRSRGQNGQSEHLARSQKVNRPPLNT